MSKMWGRFQREQLEAGGPAKSTVPGLDMLKSSSDYQLYWVYLYKIG